MGDVMFELALEASVGTVFAISPGRLYTYSSPLGSEWGGLRQSIGAETS